MNILGAMSDLLMNCISLAFVRADWAERESRREEAGGSTWDEIIFDILFTYFIVVKLQNSQISDFQKESSY